MVASGMRRRKLSKILSGLLLCAAVYGIWNCMLSASLEVAVSKRSGSYKWMEQGLRRLKAVLQRSESMCDSSGARNLPDSGGGCYIREKLSCERLPTIHSAFAEAKRSELVFVGVKRRDDRWERESYICEFPNGEMSLSDPIVRDHRSFGNGHPQYLVVITCPIPGNFSRDVTRRNILRFTVNFRLASDPAYAYMGVQICQTESTHRQLGLCTMVKGMANFIPDWLFYYKQLGVQHVYIYDNDPNTTMPADLAGYTKTGFLTIIPWAHTPSYDKTYLEVQIAHENDCLWRHRYNTQWMIKVDVDEFIQPMDPNRTQILDYLTGPHLSALGTIRVRNWFFGRPSNAKRKVVQANTVFERNQWRVPEPTPENRGRDKCIIRPINVHYFKIHGVKIGGDTLTLDPRNDLRLVHYRKDNPRHRGFRMKHLVEDTSMFDRWRKMTGGKPVSPKLFLPKPN